MSIAKLIWADFLWHFGDFMWYVGTYRETLGEVSSQQILHEVWYQKFKFLQIFGQCNINFTFIFVLQKTVSTKTHKMVNC